MDQNQNPLPKISEKAKKEVYNELADLGIDAEQKGLFFEEDFQASAAFILDNLEKVKTKKELLDFLHVLNKRWDVYQAAYLRVKKEELMEQVHNELNQLSNNSN